MTNTTTTKLTSTFVLTVIATLVGMMLPSKIQAQAAYYAAGAYAAPQQMAPAAYGYYARPVVPQGYAPRAVVYAPRPAVVAPAPRPVAQAAGNYLSFNGRYASAPSHMPAPVQYAVSAGNQLQGKPYVRGGGHRTVNDNAYDCSGSVSYTLIKAGLLSRPLSSKEFASFGQPGPGRFITIFVKPGDHVFMSICGLRLDTSGGSEGQGPRWRAKARSMDGFIMRHPFGL
jgi:hypothetical protein